MAAMLSIEPSQPLAAAGDVAACPEKKLLPAQIECFLDAAEAAGDPAVCEKSQDAVVRFQCLGLYAERSRDVAVCDRIEHQDQEGKSLRGACIAAVAFLREEPELCEGASVPELRDACYFKLVLEAAADPALCGRIQNPTFKKLCVENAGTGQN